MAAEARAPGSLQLWLLAALALGALAFLLAPWPLTVKLDALAAGVCRQRPDHSYFMGGAQLPLEARMGGIFAGFLAGTLWLWGAGRERAALLPPAALQALLLGFVALMGVDGVNALLYDLGLPALYPPQNWLRLLSGLLCGLALALLALPVLASVLWRDTDLEPSVGSLTELAAPLCIVALLQAATLSGLSWLYLPVALFALVGLVVSFTVGNAYALLVARRRSLAARTWGQALTPLLGGVLLAFGELAALAWLRWWAEAQLGVLWPI